MHVKNHSYQQIQLKEDYEGKVEATFISANTNTKNRPSVIYIHGFIDYFFHPHLSEYLNEIGFDFYALELRKHGHSILDHQHPNYCRDITEFYEEIDYSVRKIKELNNDKLILMGHSNGGLVSSSYLNSGAERSHISALILNSPFLDVNMPSIIRAILKPLSGWIGQIGPFLKLDGMLPPIYPSSIHEDHEGEWLFDKNLKPIEGFPVYFKWSRAIMIAQDELKVNSSIKVPILMLYSHDSYLPKKHEERVMKSDIVLNVEHMKSIGPKLGDNVTMVEIKDGIHDVFLSPKPVRDKAFNELKTWMNENV